VLTYIYICICIYCRNNNNNYYYYYYYTALARDSGSGEIVSKPFCSAKLNSAFPYGVVVCLCVLVCARRRARTFAYLTDSKNF